MLNKKVIGDILPPKHAENTTEQVPLKEGQTIENALFDVSPEGNQEISKVRIKSWINRFAFVINYLNN